MICRVCDSTNLEPVIDLGQQPWANHFLRAEEIGTEPYYPLRVVFCHDCHTAQLDYTVPKEVMFADHTYLSGVTDTLSFHFETVANEVVSAYKDSGGERPPSVLDIGSNDGTQLKHFQDLGCDVLGVEPSRTAAERAQADGIPTVVAYFNLPLAQSLGRRFEVINAAGVFFHMEELHSAAEGIRHCLADDGLFVVQFLWMRQILRNRAFDQIYHEHLLYYNLETLDTLLRRHGLWLFDARSSRIHGGSIVALASREPRPRTRRLEGLLAAEAEDGSNTISAYQRFAGGIAELKRENLDFLTGCKVQGKRIYGLGAPVKGNTLLNTFDIGTETLDCLVERNELRRGLYSPGKHIPVLMESELRMQPDRYYVLAWNFRDEILARHRALIERGVAFDFPIVPAGDDFVR
jgi:SAM-dependent methyltransferase